MKRREFFRVSLNETLRTAQKGFLGLQETFASLNEAVEETLDGDIPGKGDFFDSYELSYSLTLAYPREMFEQMAHNNGMPYEGVETIEIARTLHKKGVI